MKKFLFDSNNFDKNPEDEPEKPVFSEEQVAAVQQQSLAKGKAEGLAEARQKQEEQIAQMLQKMLVHADKLIADEDRREVEKNIAATRLTMKIVHKLLPQFADRFALKEIEGVILEAIEARRDEPRIAVTVPGAHLDALRARIDEVALEKGYAGRIILMADDTLGPSDCRVEWADGGAERLYARLYAQIEGEFVKAIAGMHAQQTTDNETATQGGKK